LRTPTSCPQCSELATFSKKRARFYCSECELAFDSTNVVIEPQTIFLSYAHKSERDDDFDISEELVWLIKEELEKDGHQVWIDHEGIAGGTQWRERITSAILSHTHFLSFLSKRSVRDPGVCLNEIAIALSSGRQIQTILTESEETVRQPLTISHLQWHQFEDWNAIRDGKKTGSDGEDWDNWFSSRMSQIRNNLLDVQKLNVAGDLHRLKDILEPRTFEAEIIAKIHNFQGRRWLFDACDEWLTKSTKRLFWLKGTPGIGKSAFAAKLVHQSNSSIVGFFKCDFQGSKSPEQSASECIRTLAYQLAARLPDYRTKLLYEKLIDHEKIQKKTADDLFTYLITEPLNTAEKIPEAVRLALVIDGLDEAGRNDGTNALADLIHKHAENLPSWLGIIVTSRPEPYLEQQLNKFEAASIEGSAKKNLQDLRAYLNEKLPLSLGEASRSSVIDKILDKSGGIFLYLKLIESDAALDLTNPDALPSGLDNVFMRDFKRYFPDARAYGQHTEPFLRLMAAAPGPLPINLAKDLLGWSNRDITVRVLEPLGSLIQHSAQGLVFFHKSLADWLLDQKRSGLYLVNDTGAKELGEYLWAEQTNFQSSQWQSFVVDWLSILIFNTDHWTNLESLFQAITFYKNNFKPQVVLNLCDRRLECTALTFGENTVEVVDCLNACFEALYTLGRYDEAESVCKRVIQLCRKKLQGSDTRIATSLHNLARVLKERGDFSNAMEYYAEALAMREKLFGIEHDQTLVTMNDIAVLSDQLGQTQKAIEQYKKILAIREKISGSEHKETLITTNNLAVCLKNIGCIDESNQLFTQVLIIRERILEKNHPDIAHSLNDLGNALNQQGKFEEAERHYRRAIMIREHIFGTNHIVCSTSYHNLSDLLKKMEKLDDAEKYGREALRITEKVLGPNHPKIIIISNNLGEILKSKNRDLDAKGFHLRALRISELNFGEQHRNTGVTLNHLGLLHKKNKDFVNARLCFDRALDIFKKQLGITHAKTKAVQLNINSVDGEAPSK
jgi:tetratricopeptide (TPR) repeat protein